MGLWRPGSLRVSSFPFDEPAPRHVGRGHQTTLSTRYATLLHELALHLRRDGTPAIRPSCIDGGKCKFDRHGAGGRANSNSLR